MAKLESGFQTDLMNEIRELFAGCFILKNDANYLQGVPDWLILYRDKWAILECKKNARAKTQPNQPYYVAMLNDMSFAAFVYPENRDEVLSELIEWFRR